MANKGKKSIPSSSQVKGKRRKIMGDLIFKSKEQEVRYSILSSREIGVSKFVDKEGLKEIGLLNDVMECFGAIDWEDFANLNHKTFRELTLEFLSSLTLKEGHINEYDDAAISFRLMNKDFSMSLQLLNSLFGFPLAGLDSITYMFSFNDAWSELARPGSLIPYNPSVAKSSNLKKPAHRYIHRLLSYSLFGRGESGGVVGKHELFLLWCMANKKPVAGGLWLIKHMMSVAKSEKGKILVGGLITHIAVGVGAFDENESVFVPILGSNLVNLDLLASMKMVKKISAENYVLLDGEGKPLLGESGQSSGAAEEGDPSVPFEPSFEQSPHPMMTDSEMLRAIYDKMQGMALDVQTLQSDVLEVKAGMAELQSQFHDVFYSDPDA